MQIHMHNTTLAYIEDKLVSLGHARQQHTVILGNMRYGTVFAHLFVCHTGFKVLQAVCSNVHFTFLPYPSMIQMVYEHQTTATSSLPEGRLSGCLAVQDKHVGTIEIAAAPSFQSSHMAAQVGR